MRAEKLGRKDQTSDTKKAVAKVEDLKNKLEALKAEYQQAILDLMVAEPTHFTFELKDGQWRTIMAKGETVYWRPKPSTSAGGRPPSDGSKKKKTKKAPPPPARKGAKKK